MKKMIMTFGITALTTQIHADPIERDLHLDASEILAAVGKACPVEFLQGMRGISELGTIRFSADRNFREYTIPFLAAKSPGDFEIKVIRKLSIYETVDANQVSAPEVPIKWRSTCTLTDER